jgi:hypothetical protein
MRPIGGVGTVLLVALAMLLAGCSDDPVCVDRYQQACNDTLSLSATCTLQGRRLLDVLDHPDVSSVDRKASIARARTADITRDPVDAADHDCNVRAMLLREQLVDACP